MDLGGAHMEHDGLEAEELRLSVYVWGQAALAHKPMFDTVGILTLIRANRGDQEPSVRFSPDHLPTNC